MKQKVGANFCVNNQGRGRMCSNVITTTDINSAYPIYVTIVSHNEETYEIYEQGASEYKKMRDALLEIRKKITAHNATWDLQSDWRFLEAVKSYEVDNQTDETKSWLTDTDNKNIIEYLGDTKGISMQAHSHEGSTFEYPDKSSLAVEDIRNYADVAYLHKVLGAPVPGVIGGAIYYPFDDVNHWHKFKEPISPNYYKDAGAEDWMPEILWGVGTAAHAGEEDTSVGIWRPKGANLFFKHDPEGEIIYVGGGLGSKHYTTREFIMTGINRLIEDIDSGVAPEDKMYIVTPIIFEKLFLSDKSLYDRLETALGKLDNLVKEGKVVFKNIPDIVKIWKKKKDEQYNIHDFCDEDFEHANCSNNLRGSVFVPVASENVYLEDFKNQSEWFWFNKSTGEAKLWNMDDSAGATTVIDVASPGVGFQLFATADANGDGNSDIIWRETASGNIWLWNMYKGAPVSKVEIGQVDANWIIKGVADFDNDGNEDLIWRHKITGENYIWFLDGNGKKSGNYLEIQDTSIVMEGVHTCPHDENHGEILWMDSNTREVTLWDMDRLTTVSKFSVNTPSQSDWDIKNYGDFDGDGDADVFWRHMKTGETGVWIMEEHAFVSWLPLTTVADFAWKIQDFGDYNGDGIRDVAWRNDDGTTAIWYIYKDGAMDGVYLGQTETSSDWQVLNTDK